MEMSVSTASDIADDLTTTLEGMAADTLDTAESRTEDVGVSYERMLLEGVPYEALPDSSTAQDIASSLTGAIIQGKEHLLGSTTDRVAQLAETPILIARSSVIERQPETGLCDCSYFCQFFKSDMDSQNLCFKSSTPCSCQRDNQRDSSKTLIRPPARCHRSFLYSFRKTRMNGFGDVHRGTVFWSIFGVVVTVLAGYVVYSFFGAVVVGVFLYYGLRPVYKHLDERLEHPDLTATITLLVVGLPLLLVLGYAALLGMRQADQFLQSENLYQVRTLLKPYVDLAALTSQQRLVDLLRNSASPVLSVVSSGFTWTLRLFVILTVAFYLLRDDHKIARWFRRTFDGRGGIVPFMEGIDDDLTTIYTGNLITIGISGAIAVIVYYALDFLAPGGTGVAVPLLLGLLTGVATLIPAVGMKLVYFPYTGYLIWQSLQRQEPPLWFPAVFFLAVLVFVDSIPDFFIRSYLSKGSLNMGLMLLTYVLGAVAFGWYGVFFGPIVLVFFLHFTRRVLPNLLDRHDQRFVSE